MDSLYERLLEKRFSSSRDAVEFCRESCKDYGFDIQKDTNENRNIHLRCLYKVSSRGRGKSTQRKRSSSLKSIECPWSIVVTENESSEWVFVKPENTAEHNHALSSRSKESGWPQEVYSRISQLARQKNTKIDDIRDTVKLQFPHITWNDRRFLNYLKEEQRSIPEKKSVTDRVQRLIMASTRLCSVVAANEDWASSVEGDLLKLVESYAQLTRVSERQLDSMVDLDLDMIHSETDKSRRQPKEEEHEGIAKKRKSVNMSKESDNAQIMTIPSCTLHVRSQPLRSMLEPSSQSRRIFSDMMANNSPSSMPPHMTSFGVGSLFSLTSPVSSTSSASSIQQRMDYNSTFHRNISNHSTNSSSNDILQSPSIPDSNMMIPPGFGSSGGSNTSNNNSHHHSSDYSSSMYPSMHSPYPAYNPSSSYHTQSGDMSFAFDSNPMGNTSTTYQHLSPSPVHIMRPSSTSSSPDRMTSYSMGYYNVRESSSSTSIQQRIMMQQEYEQHQRHLHHLESTSRANNQLPIIRTNTGMMVQQHEINHPQTWS